MAEFTENERFWQWLNDHQTIINDWIATQYRDASQVELVSYDQDRHVGALMVFNYQGVRKVVSVTPESLIEGLSGLTEEIRQNCIDATAAANEAADYANEKGDYAQRQAAIVENLITAIEDLQATVKSQGDTAEAQGLEAKAIKEEVSSWYSTFADNAESWFSAIVSEVSTWFSEAKAKWDEWFPSVKDQWQEWYGDTTSTWTSWYADVCEAWNSWFSDVKMSWTSWYGSVKDNWRAWFTAVQKTWSDWFGARQDEWSEWDAKEQERRTAEDIRLQMQAHPPIPSERGYWMFWNVETQEYEESGYSSRGTMDWPEFFWDYETMGIGVVICRDYSRFSIDEEGRLVFLM